MIGGTQQRGFKGARGGCRRRRRGKICVLLLLLLLLLGSMPLPTPQRIRASHDLGLIFQLKWLPCFARHAGRRCQLTETTNPLLSSLLAEKKIFLFLQEREDTSKTTAAALPGSQSVSQLCEAGQVEPDKWPLGLARPWALATSVLSVRRGRLQLQITQLVQSGLRSELGSRR